MSIYRPRSTRAASSGLLQLLPGDAPSLRRVAWAGRSSSVLYYPIRYYRTEDDLPLSQAVLYSEVRPKC